MSTGDAVATKKAEEELVRKQEKENQEPTPKRRKENLATKTPCRKSNAAKKRKALKPIQTPKQASSTPDFELGPPAPGLSPSSCTKAVSSPTKKKQPDLEISLSGFLTDDSTQSETILSHKTPEKVSYFLLLCTLCILLRYKDACSLCFLLITTNSIHFLLFYFLDDDYLYR